MTHTENESLATLIAALATTAETVSFRPELLEQARTGRLALTTWGVRRTDPREGRGSLMALSKRTRFEVLRRDNHTCRYCGGTAPDVVLTVDHVTPVALGGTDDPSNLVAACRDCNYGKASTSPDAAVVEDVKQLDLKWAAAIKRVATARARQRKKADRYVVMWLDNWDDWTNGHGETAPLPGGWEQTIRRFYELDVPIEDLKNCADVAHGNRKVSRFDSFRYFAGCAWRVVTEMQDAAKELLDSEDAGGQ